MKLSISNIAWSAEHDADMYRYLKQEGISGLEIAPTRIYTQNPYENLRCAKKWADNLSEEYGIFISSMQSIWFGHNEKIFGTQTERQVLIQYTKKAIDFAESIGCKNLVFGNPKNRDTDNIKFAMPIALEFFKEIGEYALEHNTIVAIEPNPIIYNTRFLNYTEEVVELIDLISSDGIKLNVDLGTMIYNGEDINFLNFIPKYINHVHVSEPYLNIIEKRDLHKNLFQVLRAINYNHCVSIEMCNKGNLERVKETIQYIKQECRQY